MARYGLDSQEDKRAAVKSGRQRGFQLCEQVSCAFQSPRVKAEVPVDFWDRAGSVVTLFLLPVNLYLYITVHLH